MQQCTAYNAHEECMHSGFFRLLKSSKKNKKSMGSYESRIFYYGNGKEVQFVWHHRHDNLTLKNTEQEMPSMGQDLFAMMDVTSDLFAELTSGEHYLCCSKILNCKVRGNGKENYWKTTWPCISRRVYFREWININWVWIVCWLFSHILIFQRRN